MSEAKETFDSWAVVELMGHVRMAGRVTEEEHFGGKMGRIDIPKEEQCGTCLGSGTILMGTNSEAAPCSGCNATGKQSGFFTQWFTSASVYRMTACTEEAARGVAARNIPEPVHTWELPKHAPVKISGDADFDSPIQDEDEDGEF